MTPWGPLIMACLFVLFLTIASVSVFRRLRYKKSKTVDRFKNISLSLFSILYFLLFLEIFFSVFVVQSDGYGFTAASKRWFQKYWNPINSEGYRDYEHDWKDKILFIVGDSFAAAHGIEKIDDRMAGVLAAKLGSQWTVAVLAKNGWGTRDELNALVRHGKRPTKIVVSYYVNDIEGAARENGLARPQLVKMPGESIRPLVDNSSTFNWFYWRFYRGGFGDAYWQYLKQAYGDPAIWSTHEGELDDIIGFARRNGAAIAFVVWPNLNDIHGSAAFTSRVVDFLTRNNVAVVDLTRYFWNRPRESLVVNAMDAHPNEKTNREVAQLVFDLLFRQG